MSDQASAIPARHIIEFGSTFRLRPGTAEELYGISVLPEQGVRAAVVLIHGLGEHSGRYRHVVQALRDRQIATVAIDLRGFGRSGGQRGHAFSLDEFLGDVQAAIDHARSIPALAEVPLFLFGHSYGGFLAVHYGIRNSPDLAGVILSSPALALHEQPPLAKVLAARLFSRILPRLSLDNGLDASDVSRDPEVVTAYQDDPLVHAKISCRMGQFTLEGQPEALRQASKFTLPVLVLAGTADAMVDPDGARQFYDTCGSTDKRWFAYEGFYHEILNEPEWQRVFDDMITWIDEHVPGN